MRNIVGQVVRGDDIFNRKDLINLLWERLQDTNILLAAPRRFGKTSVLYHILDHPRDDYTVISMDLEKITEPANFAIELLDRLQTEGRFAGLLKSGLKKTGGFFGSLIEEVGVGAWGVEIKLKMKQKMGKDWKETTDQILSELRNSDHKILFIFDELAMMLENFIDNEVTKQDIRAFLLWFRSLRIDPDSGLKNCRFILASSISIGQCLAKMGISKAINDLEKITLTEFTPRQSRDFVSRLCRSHKIILSRASLKRLFELVGAGIPYFIQVMFAEIYKAHKLRRVKITPAIVRRIYDEQVLGVNCKTYLQHYYERLKAYDKVDERAAKLLLKRLSLAGEVPKQDCRRLLGKEAELSGDAFAHLMADLENDFYVRYDTRKGTYAFASAILKDWWRRYYSY